jgi:creatinine amidohydrolase
MDTAVLGIGAIEQHGSHLPIGTDWMIARELARRVAMELGAVELPAIPVSMSECHGSFAGTLWLKPATLAAVLRDIVSSLRNSRVNCLLVVNCHGGNFILEPIILDLNRDHPEFRVALADENWPNLVDGLPLFETYETDIHAGEIETSLMLHLFPELVRDERVDLVPECGREFLDYVTLDQISPAGIWGTPGKASAEKGKAAMQEQVRKIVHFARQVFEDQT